MYFWMVRLLTRMPSFKSSPLMRSAPQVDAHELVGEKFESLLRDGRAQRVSDERLAPASIVSACGRGRVQRKPPRHQYRLDYDSWGGAGQTNS